jgi:septal ring factor EnvC (AmiA/AmiB activator)
MFTRRMWVVSVLAGVLLLMLAVGCGPKPPCPVGPQVVKQAQAETKQAETDLAEAVAEREALEKELSEKQAELQSLRGKPEELEKKLEALKKGSGR